MSKAKHEFRDPIHTFIEVSSDERAVIDSRPFQRLRHIHQLALTYLVYPGATHRRFEHSLGVMEVATRIFDRITGRTHRGDVLSLLPELNLPAGDYLRQYWRQVVRMAALCHDLGHLPFSHAAEDELLPQGWDHERLTLAFIQNEEMEEIWSRLKLGSEDIAKVAVGQKSWPLPLTPWERLLSEIITSNVFGADRIDYLLRDSHHAGVAYGRFDHHRLIESLWVLPFAVDESHTAATLGVEAGGLPSAEALLLARYFMFSQMYFHPVRRIYDIHLKDFLKEYLGPNGFPTETAALLRLTDNEVNCWLHQAAEDASAKGHDAARRIVRREHFKVVFVWKSDGGLPDGPGAQIAESLGQTIGHPEVRHDHVKKKAVKTEFPVLWYDESVVPAAQVSQAIKAIPAVFADVTYVEPSRRAEALRLLKAHPEWEALPRVE